MLALVARACSAPPKQQTPVEDVPTAWSTGTGETGPEGFEELYGQTLAWEDCGAGWECTTARAPLSWQDPAAGEIELAVKRQPATGERIGSLLTNPGGPGASGVDFVASLAPTVGESVTAAYDLVGFDPRGVGQSSPVVCLDDAAKDESLSRDFDTDEAGLEALAEDRRAWADACAEKTGELLGQVDTQSAARDMDMLRAVLGDEKLAYLGYSYGTQLGATYAGLFPDKVGRMVLDGAIDTSLDPDEISEQQAVGFENALRAYVEDCQAGAGCPLKGDTDAGMRQIRSLLDAAKANPLPTDSGRSVTQTLGFYGVAVTLYNDQSWPVLTQALTEAFEEGTGNGLLYLADFYNDRNADGTYSSNSAEAFRAVNCLDGRQDDDPAAMQAQLERLEEEAPTMGYFFAFGGAHVRGLGVPRRRPGVRPRRGGRRADPRHRHDQRPGHPVRVGRGPRRHARLRRPGQLGGRGAHRVRARERLPERRRGRLPRGRYSPRGRAPLLTRRAPDSGPRARFGIWPGRWVQ